MSDHDIDNARGSVVLNLSWAEAQALLTMLHTAENQPHRGYNVAPRELIEKLEEQL